jgi:hypothetical protein
MHFGGSVGITNPRLAHHKTIFVDHYSGLTIVYMQFSTNAEETVNAKLAFEAYAALQGVTIWHYHADNGQFAETKWLEAVNAHRPQQTVSFCGVGAHHQNGIAKKKISNLQENACPMMLHASMHWQQAHTVSLWLYTLQMAVDIMYSTPPEQGKDQLPIEIFALVGTSFHVFGCPVYVLHAPLRTGQAQSKWMSRAWLGIYLGMSPRHARLVALVLNPRTGLVSPQWHVKLDDNFDTVRET